MAIGDLLPLLMAWAMGTLRLSGHTQKRLHLAQRLAEAW